MVTLRFPRAPHDKPSYSEIGRDFSVRFRLDDLSGRNKVQLFRDLMDNLGITARFNSEPDETRRAQEIVAEQWDLHWGGDRP